MQKTNTQTAQYQRECYCFRWQPFSFSSTWSLQAPEVSLRSNLPCPRRPRRRRGGRCSPAAEGAAGPAPPQPSRAGGREAAAPAMYKQSPGCCSNAAALSELPDTAWPSILPRAARGAPRTLHPLLDNTLGDLRRSRALRGTAPDAPQLWQVTNVNGSAGLSRAQLCNTYQCLNMYIAHVHW